MKPNEQKETRVVHHDHGETRGWVSDAAPIIAPTILAGGQIIAAKISNGKDKGDGSPRAASSSPAQGVGQDPGVVVSTTAPRL